MDFLGDVFTWLNDSDNWQGSRGIPTRLFEHLQYSLAALAAAGIVALPLAIWLGHKRRFGTVAVNVSNVGRAIPSVAFIFVFTAMIGITKWPVIGPIATFVALLALAIPPLVTNAYVGMAEVPEDIRDAARGMGMSSWQALRRVELPMAVPLIMAGVRTAAVNVVATATIAAFVGAGGLGRFIVDGYAVQDYVEVFAGALLVAILSILTEVGLGIGQRFLTPRGLRGGELETVDVSVLPTERGNP
jgi:osmoprotectant transport system permease protein